MLFLLPFVDTLQRADRQSRWSWHNDWSHQTKEYHQHREMTRFYMFTKATPCNNTNRSITYIIERYIADPQRTNAINPRPLTDGQKLKIPVILLPFNNTTIQHSQPQTHSNKHTSYSKYTQSTRKHNTMSNLRSRGCAFFLFCPETQTLRETCTHAQQ